MGELGLAPSMQPDRSKRAPLVPAGGVSAGRGAGGSGEYVHTHSNIFPKNSSLKPQVFEGTTFEGEAKERRRARVSTLQAVYNALYYAGETECDLRDAAHRLMQCGNWHQKFNLPCGDHRCVPYPCNLIFCSHCSSRRSKPLIKRIVKAVDPKKRYWLLTITVKNWATLTKDKIAEDLLAKFSELRETREWKKFVTGGVYSVEATFNRERGDWHPHLHVLIETTERLPKLWVYRVRVLWRRLTGSHVINLQTVYGIDKKGRKTRRINGRALRELVKYASKAADFSRSPARVVEFYRAFTGVRRLQTFGSFFNRPSEAKEPDEDGRANSEELVGCKCGQCRWKDAAPAGLFRTRDTFIDANGNRQLRLFESFDTSPPKTPEVEVPATVDMSQLDLFFQQRELGFGKF